jgi:hypothetical protein
VGFQPCQHEDPFTRRVREVYRANVVRAPRAGVDPLDVLAVRKRYVEPRGRLATFIEDPGAIELPPMTIQPAAGLSGLRSARLDLNLALGIAATFLGALGVPAPGAELNLSLWGETNSIEFEVRDVKELSVDVGQLGRLLTGRRIVHSPASEIFFRDEDVRMLIITRTLISRQFALLSRAKSGQSAAVTMDAIASLLGKAAGEVEWAREAADTVSFRGQREVTFAFAAVPCVLQADGTFLFGLEADQLVLGAPPEQVIAAHKPIVDEDGLLILDTV